MNRDSWKTIHMHSPNLIKHGLLENPLYIDVYSWNNRGTNMGGSMDFPAMFDCQHQAQREIP